MRVLFLYFKSLVGWQFPRSLSPGIWRAHARRELHSTKRYWVSEKIHHHESKKTGRKSPINVLCYLLEHKHFLRRCIRELKYKIPARSEAKNLKSKRKRLRYRIIQFIQPIPHPKEWTSERIRVLNYFIILLLDLQMGPWPLYWFLTTLFSISNASCCLSLQWETTVLEVSEERDVSSQTESLWFFKQAHLVCVSGCQWGNIERDDAT